MATATTLPGITGHIPASSLVEPSNVAVIPNRTPEISPCFKAIRSLNPLWLRRLTNPTPIKPSTIPPPTTGEGRPETIESTAMGTIAPVTAVVGPTIPVPLVV